MSALLGLGLDPIAQFFRLGAVYVLVEVVVDENHGGGPAARETLHELDRDFAVGRNLAAVGVEFLLERGARPDLFCAAMLGQLDVVRSLLTVQPALIDSKGPHGFTLHFHAQVGGKESESVLDYLQSIKKLELKPVPFLTPKKDSAPSKTEK